jgi:hypothetical protein
MYEALKEMFERDNTLGALTLKSQLQSTKMKKGDTVAIFFMKISEIKEQLETIGEIMSDRELVLTTNHSQQPSKTVGAFSLEYQWKRSSTTL